MAIGAAIIGGIAAMGSSAIAAKGRTQNVDKDQRETSLEEMFSDSFLQSLTDSERNALETQVSNVVNTGQESAIGREATTGSQATDRATSTAGQTDITRGTDESQAAINAILSGANQPDGEAAIQASIARVLESGAPSIANVGNTAGSFDSTVTAQLQNDLAIQAARAGAETDLQQQNLNTQNILAAIQAAQAGNEGQAQTEIGSETGTVDTTQDTTSQQNTSSTNTTDTTTSTEVDETNRTAQQQQQQQGQTNVSDILTDVETSAGAIDKRFNPQQSVIAANSKDAFQNIIDGGNTTNAGGLPNLDLDFGDNPLNIGTGSTPLIEGNPSGGGLIEGVGNVSPSEIQQVADNPNRMVIGDDQAISDSIQPIVDGLFESGDIGNLINIGGENISNLPELNFSGLGTSNTTAPADTNNADALNAVLREVPDDLLLSGLTDFNIATRRK